MSRRRRPLHPDEEALWKRVAQTTTPLFPDSPTRDTPVLTTAPPKPRANAATPPPIDAFTIGQRATRTSVAHNIAPAIDDHFSGQHVRMDGKAFGKLKRGKLSPDARIDLHGMTLARAHPALTGFLLRAHAEGKRLVLVITGKGKDRDEAGPMPVRRGVLKHQVPQWLTMPPLSEIVLQVAPAHLKHGGTGAYYVYLKRIR